MTPILHRILLGTGKQLPAHLRNTEGQPYRKAQRRRERYLTIFDTEDFDLRNAFDRHIRATFEVQHG